MARHSTLTSKLIRISVSHSFKFFFRKSLYNADKKEKMIALCQKFGVLTVPISYNLKPLENFERDGL